MADFTLWHNPRCSKSRQALALLEENGIQPEIVEYLKTPPTAAGLKAVIAKLGIEPKDLVRKGEDIYREKYAGKTLTDAQWIAAMVKDPVLIERPILIRGKRAVVGRPPEAVETLIR